MTIEIGKGTAQEIAKAAAQANPANVPEKRSAAPEYPPMDLPNLKLDVPPMPGFYLYWHLGKNVNRALRSGYTFVEAGDVELEQTGLANSAVEPGGTDLGTRVSVSAGETGEEKEQRLYLMKIPLEVHEQHMRMKTARNEEIAVQLRAGALGADGDPDRNKRYMKAGQDLFYPKAERR